LNKKVTSKTLSSAKSGLTFDPNVDGFLAPKSNFGNLRDVLSTHLGGKKCTTSGSIHCKCDKVSQFPTLELKLTGNDQLWSFTAAEYVYRKKHTSGTYNGQYRCHIKIHDNHNEDWVAGRLFLTKIYAVFNQDDKKLSLSYTNKKAQPSGN
jgi:hypothetical protein